MGTHKHTRRQRSSRGEKRRKDDEQERNVEEKRGHHHEGQRQRPQGVLRQKGRPERRCRRLHLGPRPERQRRRRQVGIRQRRTRLRASHRDHQQGRVRHLEEQRRIPSQHHVRRGRDPSRSQRRSPLQRGLLERPWRDRHQEVRRLRNLLLLLRAPPGSRHAGKGHRQVRTQTSLPPPFAEGVSPEREEQQQHKGLFFFRLPKDVLHV